MRQSGDAISDDKSIVNLVGQEKKDVAALCEETRVLLDFIKKALFSARCPDAPEIFLNDDTFNNIFDYINMIRDALRQFAQGNILLRVTHRGFIAGCIKELQAHLRHLTWHADRMASGDFAQHIDFMGNFAESFNRMSQQFYSALTALKESEANLLATTEHLHLNEERWKLAVACTQDGILDIDLKERRAFFSKRLWEILRYPAHEEDIDFEPEKWSDLVYVDDRSKWHELLLTVQSRTLDDQSRMYTEFRIKGGDSKYRWLGTNYMLLHDVEGEPYRFVGACEDIQERREREEFIRLQATHDQLTGLPNRYLYNDRLLQQMVMAKRNNSSLIFVVWDLDGFKKVNDTHGHMAGDALLVSVARLMRSCLRETDTLARFGGDEFVMLLASASGSEEEVARQTTSRIFDTLKSPIDIGEANVRIGASCGISFFPRHTSEQEELFNLADKALYIAKGAGKNRSLIWSPEIEEI
ncbi:MAG: diguanylate cyclase [Synergistaceae bacterium]|jgi:diguanylate cyclase (GGDEF)-like protein/PAS domain S-box-containing protein|nr:diguanylate cyclase [Synergistaceae bacterium]